MRGATGVTLQHHQILRLPQRKLSWLILVTYETSVTLRGATDVTLRYRQILHLPRKMTFMIDPRHIWNVIYVARSNRCYPPTSPNTAPATTHDSPNSQKFGKTAEPSYTRRGRSEHDPRMIRPWSCQSATRRATEVTFHAQHAVSFEKYNIPRSGYHSKFHQMLPLRQKVTPQHHHILHQPQKVTLVLHQTMHLPQKVTLALQQIVHLPRKVTIVSLLFFDFLLISLLFLFILLSYYLTELVLDWTLLYYSLTLLFSYSIILYSTILDSAISFVYRKFLN